jgi:hypothetical protein
MIEEKILDLRSAKQSLTSRRDPRNRMPKKAMKAGAMDGQAIELRAASSALIGLLL